MNTAKIFDIQKFSVHDGPGIRTIVFLKGCPLHCEWCANPESQNAFEEIMVYPDKCIGCKMCIDECDKGALYMSDDKLIYDRSKCNNCGKCTKVCYSGSRQLCGCEMTVEEVIKEVDQDMIFYKKSGGGITFSGGEPGLHPEFVKEIAENYKNHNISTAMETCGFVPWENYEKLYPYIDLFMFDLKCINDEKHKRYTGCSNIHILENLKKLVEKAARVVVRIPIIPTVNDSNQDIIEFGDFINSLNGKIDTVHILAYHNLGMNKYRALDLSYKLEKIEPPTNDKMEEIKKTLEQYVEHVVIGG